jgi:hypothetical protein
MEDDGLGVAIVGDCFERDVAQPSTSLASDTGQPKPVVVGVDVYVAVRLFDVSTGDDRIMQTSPVDRLFAAFQGALELLGCPLTVPMAGRGVEAVGIDLSG